jgi:hypothetical protein
VKVQVARGAIVRLADGHACRALMEKGVVPVSQSQTSHNGTGRVESFDSRTHEIASHKKGDSSYEYLTVGFSWTKTQGPESPEISETEVSNT